MSAKSGQLEPLKLFKIFRALQERRNDGLLTLTRGQVIKKARITGGQPVRVVSNVKREGLLSWLGEQGTLTDADLERVRAFREQSQASPEVALQQLGILDAQRVRAAENRLARRRLLETFTWRDGDFSFEETPARREAEDDPIDVTGLLLEAAARVVTDADCQGFVGGYGGHVARLTPANDAHGATFDSLFGSTNVRSLLASRPLTREELLRALPDPERVSRQLFSLVIAGLGVFQPASAAPPQVPARPSPPSAPAPATPTRPPVAAPRPQSNTLPPPSRPTMPPVNATPAPTRVPVAAQGTPQPVRSALGTSATPQPARPPVPARAVVSESNTPTPAPRVTRTTLSPSRSTSDRTPAPRPQAGDRSAAQGFQGTVDPSMTPSPNLTEPPTSGRPARGPSEAPRDTKPMPEASRRTLAEIERVYAELKKRTHYELLSVPRDATPEAIKAAFRKLARDYHVDRFTRYGLSADVMKRIQDVFMALNRAHEVLADPAQRKEFDLTLEMAAKGQKVPNAGADVAAIFRAEQLIREGVILLRNGNATAAKQRFDEALQASPNDLLAQAGQAYAVFVIDGGAGGNKPVAGKARGILEGLNKNNESRDEPYVYLGRVYRALEMPNQAIQAFQKAIEVNPRCAEAASELRHLMRKADGPPEKSGGLFRKKA